MGGVVTLRDLTARRVPLTLQYPQTRDYIAPRNRQTVWVAERLAFFGLGVFFLALGSFFTGIVVLGAITGYTLPDSGLAGLLGPLMFFPGLAMTVWGASSQDPRDDEGVDRLPT